MKQAREKLKNQASSQTLASFLMAENDFFHGKFITESQMKNLISTKHDNVAHIQRGYVRKTKIDPDQGILKKRQIEETKI